jgi:hypothetical protein
MWGTQVFMNQQQHCLQQPWQLHITADHLRRHSPKKHRIELQSSSNTTGFSSTGSCTYLGPSALLYISNITMHA